MPPRKQLTKEQEKVLLDKIEEKPNHGNGYLLGISGAREMDEFWRDVADTINPMAPQFSKQPYQWRDYWIERKRKFRRKMCAVRRALHRGGVFSITPTLTDVEKRITDIMFMGKRPPYTIPGAMVDPFPTSPYLGWVMPPALESSSTRKSTQRSSEVMDSSDRKDVIASPAMPPIDLSPITSPKTAQSSAASIASNGSASFSRAKQFSAFSSTPAISSSSRSAAFSPSAFRTVPVPHSNLSTPIPIHARASAKLPKAFGSISQSAHSKPPAVSSSLAGSASIPPPSQPAIPSPRNPTTPLSTQSDGTQQNGAVQIDEVIKKLLCGEKLQPDESIAVIRGLEYRMQVTTNEVMDGVGKLNRALGNLITTNSQIYVLLDKLVEEIRRKT